MGIQINGQTDTITAIDGGLNVSGADLGSASAGSLNVTGIVTASGFSGNVTGNVLGNVTGNVTGNLTGNVNASGVSTFTNGPVFIGSGTSTGTASQPLQVTGGAYVSGNLGIGSTNPGAKLHLIGNQYLQGGNYFTDTTSGYFWAGNGSFAGGIYGSNSGNVTTIISPQTINLVTSNTQRVTIDSSGRVAKPYTPHIFGSVTNTSTVSNSYANSFNVITSTELTFSTDRITVPVAGLYLITFSSISNTSTGRFDANIFINGISRLNMLNEDNGTGFHYKNGSLTMKLAANDYIQFFNQNWYNNTSTSFDAWKTASVAFLG